MHSGAADVHAASFRTQAETVIRGVRAALAELVAAIDLDPMQPQELARRIGVDKSLSWKISRLIREDDSWAAVPHFPGKTGFRIFVDSARKAGAPQTSVERVKKALGEFDRFVVEHSGDRETLLMMAGGASERAARESGETHRRLAFRGQSATWGVQARVHLSLHFVAPARRAGLVDAATVGGLIDFRRLRPDVAWSFATIARYIGDGRAAPVSPLEAIDARLGPGEPPLLGEFSTKPLPLVRAVPVREGVERIELAEGPVGRSAAATVLSGWFHRNAYSIYRTEEDQFGEHFVNLSTPTELVIHDLYAHQALRAVLPPTNSVYSNLPAGQTYSPAARDKGLLPVGTEVTLLGGNPPALVAPEVSFYEPLVQSVFGRLGWNADDFLGFRFRLKYPPIPSVAVFRYPLPEKPA
ncbi:MAG: hypothetical protein U1D55_07190 [Phycisphaerae bacterium]